jgi:hypothetical protein
MLGGDESQPRTLLSETSAVCSVLYQDIIDVHQRVVVPSMPEERPGQSRPTKLLRDSTKRECRNLGISLDNTEFQEHIYKPALQAVLSSNTSTHNEMSYLDSYPGKTITLGRGQSLSSTSQIPSVYAALSKFRVQISDRHAFHKHVKGNVVVTDCATNRFKFTALPGFLDQALKFVNGSLKEREILDLCNRMLRVRKKTHLLTSKLSGISSISDEQWEIEHTEMLACVARSARAPSSVNIPHLETRADEPYRVDQISARGSPQTKTGHTVRRKLPTLNWPTKSDTFYTAETVYNAIALQSQNQIARTTVRQREGFLLA